MPSTRTGVGFQRLTGRPRFISLSPRVPGFDWPRTAAGRRGLGPSPAGGGGVGERDVMPVHPGKAGNYLRRQRRKRPMPVSAQSPFARQAADARQRRKRPKPVSAPSGPGGQSSSARQAAETAEARQVLV